MTHTRAVATHLYTPDQAIAPDHRGRRPCTCGFPRQWRGHDVPDTDPDQAAHDARRLGEKETP